MELSAAEFEVQKMAIQEIEERKEELIQKFVEDKRPLRLSVASFFMAGSPGSGKTEFSKRYMPSVLDKKNAKSARELFKRGIDINSADTLFVRIDVDEIREFLSLYQKTDIEKGVQGNSHVIQKAANKGLDIIRNYCFQENISFLHDGTFGNFDTMRKMIKKSLKAGRQVQIFYLYIDPLVAWQFTRAREYLEGRNIVKDKFIDQFFQSKINVDKIKEEFGKDIRINCILKNSNNDVVDTEFNVASIDSFLKKRYNQQAIKEYSIEDLQTLIC